MRDEYKKILDAYTSPLAAATPTIKRVANNAITSQVQPKPSIAPGVMQTKAENSENVNKTLSLDRIDTDRKALHAAYNIVDIIYRVVKDFDTATKVIKTIANVHKKERRRMSRG